MSNNYSTHASTVRRRNESEGPSAHARATLTSVASRYRDTAQSPRKRAAQYNGLVQPKSKKMASRAAGRTACTFLSRACRSERAAAGPERGDVSRGPSERTPSVNQPLSLQFVVVKREAPPFRYGRPVIGRQRMQLPRPTATKVKTPILYSTANAQL